MVAVSIYCGVSIVSIIIQLSGDFLHLHQAGKTFFLLDFKNFFIFPFFLGFCQVVLTHRLKLVNQSPPSLLFLQAWRRRRLSRRIRETSDLKSQRCSRLARSDLPNFPSSPQVTQTSTFLSPPVSSSGRFGLVYTVCSVLKPCGSEPSPFVVSFLGIRTGSGASL